MEFGLFFSFDQKTETEITTRMNNGRVFQSLETKKIASSFLTITLTSCITNIILGQGAVFVTKIKQHCA